MSFSVIFNLYDLVTSPEFKDLILNDQQRRLQGRDVLFHSIHPLPAIDFQYFFIISNIYDIMFREKIEHFWLTDEQREQRICRIGNLPMLALIQVIQSMNTVEQVKLSLCSKRMKINVKQAKMKISSTSIRICDQYSSIDLDKPSEVILYSGNRQIKQRDMKVKRNELSKWCEHRSIIQNTLNVFNEIQSIFHIDKVIMLLYLCDWNTRKLHDKFRIISFCVKKCDTLRIFGANRNNVTSEDLNFIMQMMLSTQSLTLWKLDIPIDFTHKNAFKFHDIQYDDARWVQIEDLFSLRNSNIVKLGKNNLSCSDFNNFIKYWVNCDCEMFKMLQFELKEINSPMKLFEGMVVLQSFRNDISFYFIATKPTENRKKIILCAYNSPKTLRLTTWTPDEPLIVCGKIDKTIENEYKILKILEKKHQLEKELMETEDRENEIRAEIQELNDKLLNDGVYYDNGQATIG